MRELPDLLEDVERDREIAAIRERLAQLEFEKAELEGSLNKLLAAQEVLAAA
jgi:predicted nuclease with TOPRIM domain